MYINLATWCFFLFSPFLLETFLNLEYLCWPFLKKKVLPSCVMWPCYPHSFTGYPHDSLDLWPLLTPLLPSLSLIHMTLYTNVYYYVQKRVCTHDIFLIIAYINRVLAILNVCGVLYKIRTIPPEISCPIFNDFAFQIFLFPSRPGTIMVSFSFNMNCLDFSGAGGNSAMFPVCHLQGFEFRVVLLLAATQG